MLDSLDQGQVTVADVNGDGGPDLIAVHNDTTGFEVIEVALGTHDGSFGNLAPVIENCRWRRP